MTVRNVRMDDATLRLLIQLLTREQMGPVNQAGPSRLVVCAFEGERNETATFRVVDR